MTRLQQIQQLLDQSPDDAFLRFALAKELESLGKPEDALQAWAWFPQFAPEYSGFYYHYSKLLAQQGRHEDALQMIRSGLEMTKQQGNRHDFSELQSLYEETSE